MVAMVEVIVEVVKVVVVEVEVDMSTVQGGKLLQKLLPTPST